MEKDLIKDSKHPRALYMLFFTEMWERFSYYGMRAIFVLYLTSEMAKGGLGWSSAEAGHLYGIYTGLVYVTPIIGGILADRILGHRAAVIIGGILMALGHGALAIEEMSAFYTGLGLLIIGNGFFKPNISTMVGQLYPEGSGLKDSAYTIFYMGINLGALLGTLVCSYLGEKISWHLGFGAAGIGMVLGLVVFYLGKGTLGEIGKKPIKSKAAEIKDTAPLTSDEIDRLLVIGCLSFFSILFWVAFEQAGSSMNIYAFKYTDRTIFGFEIPAGWFQSVNPMFIILLAPLFSMIWLKLGRKNPSGPIKFALGFLFLGTGFLALVFGASTIPTGATEGNASIIWLVLAYMFHTMGELCLSPVGLSFVNKLSPVRLLGLMFGVWFLASAIGNYISGALSGMIDELAKTQSLSAFFAIFVVIAFIGAVLAFSLNTVLKKWMHGVN